MDIHKLWRRGGPPYEGYKNSSLPGWGNITGYNYTLAKRTVKYLKDTVEHPNLTYVTLFGNARLVPPSYYVYISHCNDYNNWIPTDFFYASPDYDLFPNVMVGRLPVNSSAEAEHVVEKIEIWDGNVSYDWFQNVSLGGGKPFGRIYYIGELIAADSINRNFFNGMNVTEFFRTDGNFDKANLTNSLSGDTGMLYVITHGNGYVLYIEGDPINVDDLLSLPHNAKVPIVVSIACMDGAFDTNVLYGGFNTSFGEGVLLSDASGIAYIGGSRVNHGEPIYYIDKGNLRITKESYMAGMLTYVFRAYHEGANSLGSVTREAMKTYLLENDFCASDPKDNVTYFEFTLLGDPALQIPAQQVGPSYQTPNSTALNPEGYDDGGMPCWYRVNESITVRTTTDSPKVYTKHIIPTMDLVLNRIENSTVDNTFNYNFKASNPGYNLIRSASEDKKERWFYLRVLPARFNEVYSDYGEDTDGDGLYNYLVINVGVNVTEAGNYTVEGNLNDKPRHTVDSNSNTTYLSEGNQTVQLRFKGFKLRENEYNGTYDLKSLSLLYNDSITVDNRDYAYTTTWYNWTEFEPPVTIYVPDDYTTIQAAVDNASAGGTVIVRDGTYIENVDVAKRLTIRSENGSASTIVNAADSADHVFDVSMDYVNISGFTVQNATVCDIIHSVYYTGIYLGNVNQCNISNNNASNNCLGICLESSSNNNIITDNNANNNIRGIVLVSSSNNTITDNNVNNDGTGIFLLYSSSNIITDNNASYNSDGIDLDYSGNNTLRNNLMSDNRYNFEVDGESYSELNNDIDTSNLVDGKPIYYLVGASDTVIDPSSNAGTVYCINCDNVTVKDLTLEKNGFGIFFYNTSKSRIENNHISNGECICLLNSSNNSITGNDVGKGGIGIYLWKSRSNTITDNNACYSVEGITLDYSRSNTIANNNVNNNGKGIILAYSSSNILTGNNASYSRFVGMTLMNSGNNTLRNNLMSGNYYNFDAEGKSYSELDNDIDISNLVDGKPIYYLVDASDTVIDSATNAGTVYCIHCDNVTVKDLTLAKNPTGIYLYNTSSSRIENNHISDCSLCIYICNSSNNIITGNNASGINNGIQLVFSIGNTITDNDVHLSLSNNIILWGSDNNTITGNNVSCCVYNGIWLTRSSNNNTITNNIASYSVVAQGICLDSGSNNTIIGNTASNNGEDGIYLEGSSNNTITGNTASNNGEDGIYLDGSENNLITDNIVNSNHEKGIYMSSSSSNTLTNNTASNNANYDFYDEYSHGNKVKDLAISSYPTTISFIYDNGIGIKSVTSPEPDPAGKVNIGKYVNVTNATEDSWILLNVSYSDADVTHMEEASLRLYHCMDMEWVEIPGSGVNTVENYVYANVTSFSQIAAFGDPKTPVTIYVPDDYTTIQAAVDNASAGGTIIVRDGTYTENVNVDKRLTIRSENGSDSTIVTAANSSYSVFKVTADYVTISGFTVTEATEYLDTSGIYLIDADYCNIYDNKASNNEAGIYLYNSSNNTIKNNAVNSNEGTGIVLDMSSKCNTITNNTASTNGVGIGLGRFTSSNILTDNKLMNNNGDGGIYLYSSCDNKLMNNNASNNNYGIYLLHSSNNTFSGNTAFNNTDYDFYSDEGSRDNSIADFTISSYPTTISFLYEHGIVIKAVAAPEPDPAGKRNISKYVNATNQTEDSWILLNVSYNDADVTHVEEASLRLYRSTDMEWVEIPGSGVNTAENYVYANVTSFSQIAPFGDPTPKPTPTPSYVGGAGGGRRGVTPTPGPTLMPIVSPTPIPTPSVTLTPTPPTPVPTPTPAPTPTPKPFGFEVGFAIAGLLTVAYLVLRRRE